MELLAGRNLFSDTDGTSSQVLVNQALIKTLGLANPASAVGKTYVLRGKIVVIRGVIRDSYTQPMSNKVDPVSILFNPQKFTGVAMSISANNASETLAGIERAWKKRFTRITFANTSLWMIL